MCIHAHISQIFDLQLLCIRCRGCCRATIAPQHAPLDDYSLFRWDAGRGHAIAPQCIYCCPRPRTATLSPQAAGSAPAPCHYGRASETLARMSLRTSVDAGRFRNQESSAAWMLLFRPSGAGASAACSSHPTRSGRGRKRPCHCVDPFKLRNTQAWWQTLARFAHSCETLERGAHDWGSGRCGRRRR